MSDESSRNLRFVRPFSAITVSFASDDVRIGGQKSELFQRLDQIAPTQVWQTQFIRAFRFWGRLLGVKVKQVADQGEAFGSSVNGGEAQSGFTRIGGRRLSEQHSAIAFDAFDRSSASWAGDVVVNTDAAIRTRRDIYAIALHEAGHVFGLPHDDRVESIMNPNGNASQLPTIRDAKRLKKLLSRYQLRRRDISSIRDVKRKWGKSIGAIEMENRDESGARFQSKFTVEDESKGLYLRVPGVALKQDDLVLSVSLYQLGDGLAGNASVSVFDERGRRQDAFVTNRSTGSISIQLQDLDPRDSYFLRVNGDETPGPHAYGLVAEYEVAETEFGVAYEGRLRDDNRRDYHIFDVDTSRLMNIGIRAEGRNDSQSIWMIMRNESGSIVETFSSFANGLNDARAIWLRRGEYSLEVVSADRGERFRRLDYEIISQDPTRPGGPGIIDPTLKPSGGNSNLPGFNIDLHEAPIMLASDVSTRRLWHDRSDSSLLNYITAGGGSGLLPPG